MTPYRGVSLETTSNGYIVLDRYVHTMEEVDQVIDLAHDKIADSLVYVSFKDYAQSMAGKLIKLTAAKNHDYAGEEDAYSNFRMCSKLGISVTDGFLTRMCDKIARIMNFQKSKTLKVKSEKITDTMSDLANYCMLLSGYLRDRLDLGDWSREFYHNVIIAEVEQGQDVDELISAIQLHMTSVSIFIKRGQTNAALGCLQKIANYSLQLAYATENLDLVRNESRR